MSTDTTCLSTDSLIFKWESILLSRTSSHLFWSYSLSCSLVYLNAFVSSPSPVPSVIYKTSDWHAWCFSLRSTFSTSQSERMNEWMKLGSWSCIYAALSSSLHWSIFIKNSSNINTPLFTLDFEGTVWVASLMRLKAYKTERHLKTRDWRT